jgi:hypothetical protein
MKLMMRSEGVDWAELRHDRVQLQIFFCTQG